MDIDKQALDRWITREPEESLECKYCQYKDDCDGDVCKKNEKEFK
jgi:hypothetical protein